MNAGHNPPVTVRGGGEVSYLMPEGKPDKPLGVMEGLRYRQGSLTLAPGDMMFLYTDGVTEAVNETAELYGEERLKDELSRIGGSAAVADVLSGLHAAIKSFAGSAEQADDITMLGIRYLGN